MSVSSKKKQKTKKNKNPLVEITKRLARPLEKISVCTLLVDKFYVLSHDITIQVHKYTNPQIDNTHFCRPYV